LHQAVSTILTGWRGGRLFHSGVDFVFAPIGVVADACHVVNA
jgi:hypothetical protein